LITALRVLLCCEHYPPSVGGVQEVMRQIAERLVARGVDVTVATGIHNERVADAIINGVRVVSFPISGNMVKGLVGPIHEYQRFLCQGSFEAVLIKAAQQWTFDAAIDVVPLMSARRVFIPCGFSGLHDPRYQSYYELMPGWLRQYDQLVFYASDYQDINFARRHGLTNLRHITNGVDEREFLTLNENGIQARIGVPYGDTLLISVGSRISAKGHWEVLEAFRLAKLDGPATLVINGNSPGHTMLSRLRRTVKHAIGGRVPLEWLASRINRLPGKRVLVTNLSRGDLLSLFVAADIFIFGSHIEYSPLVLFEASAAGLPFIATSAGNSLEIANWLSNGTIVAARSIQTAEVAPCDLAKAIENALEDPEELKAAGVRGRLNIFNKGFYWERIIEDYFSVLFG